MSDSSKESSGPRKNDRAITLLDKHINQKSKMKSTSNSSPIVLTQWFNSQLPAPPSTSPVSVQTHKAANDVSPTPKRRRVNNMDQTSSTVPHLDLRRFELNNDTRLERSTSESNSASPIRKTVAFSDKIEIESSPTQTLPESSPRHPPSSDRKPPSKSILRNSKTPSSPVKYNTIKASSDVTYSKTVSNNLAASNAGVATNDFLHADPRKVEYWADGEIHSLLYPNNIKEFRDIIEGGISFLNMGLKKFEIFATFNNIIPIIPNGFNATDVIDKKIGIIVENLDNLIKILISNLKDEQKELLEGNEKKNPFTSRQYVQIIRLLGIMLSNFKIICWLDKRKPLQVMLKEIYKLSEEALVNENSSKVIIISQLTFLKDEKFSTYYLNKNEILRIIDTFTKIKDLKSTNLMNEKLLLMRCYINKFPKLMIPKISDWLPGELLSKIVLDEDMYAIKITHTSIAVLLDLLKKCLDVEEGHQEIFKYVEVKTLNESVPEGTLEKFNSTAVLNDLEIDINSMTLGQLLRNKIKYLVLVQKDYKVGIDLWLAMVGLLFNNKKNIIHLLDKDKTHDKSSADWLNLVQLCFKNSDGKTKLLSLKVWRILTYCICTHVTELDSAYQIPLLNILKIPLEISKTEHGNDNVRDGIIYYVTGIIYTAFLLLQKNLSYETFQFFFDNLVKPIYENFIFNSPSFHVQTRLLGILLQLLGAPLFNLVSTSKHITSNAGKSKNIRNDKKVSPNNPVKVIASVGISRDHIVPLPTHLSHPGYTLISRLFLNSLPINAKFLTVKTEIILDLIAQIPDELKTEEVFQEYRNIVVSLTKLYKTSYTTKNKNDVLFECFSRCTCLLGKTFPNIILNPKRDIFSKYLASFDNLFTDNADMLIKLLKDIIKYTRPQISELTVIELFLTNTNDKNSRDYIQNWVGSTLLSPMLTYPEFQSLTNIVNMIPSSQIVENYLDLCVKTSLAQNPCTTLNIRNWKDKQLIFFIKTYISKCSNRLDDDILVLLHDVLPDNIDVFDSMVPLLIQINRTDLIRHCIEKKPSYLNTPAIMNYHDLSEILPDDRKCYLLNNLKDFSAIVQYKIIMWVAKTDEFTLFKKNYVKIESCLFLDEPCSENILDKKAFIKELFTIFYEKQAWQLVAILVVSCINHGYESNATEFLANIDSNTLNSFPPKAIATIVNRCGSMNPKLLLILHQFFSNKEKFFLLELVSELISLKKIDALLSVSSELINFFIDDQHIFTEDEQGKSIGILEKFLAQLQKYNERTSFNFTKDLMSSLPKSKTKYLSKLASCVGSAQNSTVVGVTQEELKLFSQKLEDCDNQEVNKTLAIVQPKAQFVVSRDIRDVYTNKIQDSDEIQVPATQKDEEKEIIAIGSQSQSNNDLNNSSIEEENKNNTIVSKNLAIVTSIETPSGTQSQEIRQLTGNHLENESKEVSDLPEVYSPSDTVNKRIDDSSFTQTLDEVEDPENVNMIQAKSTQIGPTTGDTQINNISDTNAEAPDLEDKVDEEKQEGSSNLYTVGNVVLPFACSPEQRGVDNIQQGEISTLSTSRNLSIEDTGSSYSNQEKGEDGASKSSRSPHREIETHVEDEHVTVPELNMHKHSIHIISNNVTENMEQPRNKTHIEGTTISKEKKGLEDMTENSSIGEAKLALPMATIVDDPQSRSTNVDTEERENSTTSKSSHLIGALEEQQATQDDFVLVEEPPKDTLLDELDKEISQDMTETNASTAHKDVVLDSPMPAIRIPIFNTLKIGSGRIEKKKHTKIDKALNKRLNLDSSAIILHQQEDAPCDVPIITKDHLPEEIDTVTKQAPAFGNIPVNNMAEEVPLENDLQSSFVIDGKEDGDGTSRDTTPSLRMHFPCRKSRKLVNRLRTFNPDELASLPVEERRNLRIELLDFMMKLEYYTGDKNN
ncbi:DNA-binding protein RIF1 NDAI_0B04690 [Naumovozyma dairenensis CBS 421]|uniref:Telomere-associated protein Rif1 N-terminal domain-containing protein n=1 Tax=Naumovozyma dairenensis (strain ATCC 10597 / BCRC 20456 / CBS 421 / NBRC 0211 / NRRL Y-12639) TaxID=1071378 RepID=G0W6U3_NAUDC|nr:hypothetical protein NDAI_0B04690 [Naumovozyma dairenensis CBS 421]CCD23504.1 hypothetical protein NDAI_0B04690 [Naumovozyma dairenensis CBS 421]